MSLVIWSSFESLGSPLYLLAFVAFLAALAGVARSAATPGLAAEYGGLFAFVWGVAVWGSVGYWYNLSAYEKLFHAGGIIMDGIWIAAVLNIVFRHLEDRSAS